MDLHTLALNSRSAGSAAYPRREDFKPAYREPIQKFTLWDSWQPERTTDLKRPAYGESAGLKILASR